MAPQKDLSRQLKPQHIPHWAAVLVAIVSAILVVYFPSARSWLYSGCAVQSLMIIYASTTKDEALNGTPPWTSPWTTLGYLNVIYLLTSTSWLQYYIFALVCWSWCLITLLLLSPTAAYLTREVFRRLLGGSHFIHGSIAHFNPPALHFDTAMQGLLVIRGWSFSFSSLTLELHGFELGQNLSDKMHLVVYCDSLVFRLGRSLDIGPAFGVIKREPFDVNVDQLEKPSDWLKNSSDSREPTLESIDKPLDDVEIARHATDYAAKENGPERGAGMNSADSRAQYRYDGLRKMIEVTSPIQQSLAQLGGPPPEDAPPLEHQKNRAAVCEKLAHILSVPHHPRKAIKVTSILDLIPIWLRRILVRVPLLLRLILAPLSYLHPVSWATASCSTSGTYLAELLQNQMYKKYSEDRSEVRQLVDSMKKWLVDAEFCWDIAGIEGIAKIPVRATEDMFFSLKVASTAIMRVVSSPDGVTPALRVEGGDAVFTVPTYVLPAHEHLLPPPLGGNASGNPSGPEEKPPGSQEPDEDEQPGEVEDKAEADMTFHLKAPFILDSMMVDFASDMIEASIILEIEDDDYNYEETTPNDSKLDKARKRMKNERHEAQHTVKKGFKRAAFSVRGDDRVPWLVNKVAEKLEIMQGDFGYSGPIPIDLASYRRDDTRTKFLA